MQHGVHCWYDMLQRSLTLDGMKQGVYDSDVFLLVLTETTLTRWFCQQEILEAIRLGKPIVLLIEEDARFKPFQIDPWMAGLDFVSLLGRKVPVRGFSANPDVKNIICKAVDAALSDAVMHRRRDFEADSMIRALCASMGIKLPSNTMQISGTNGGLVSEETIEVAVLGEQYWGGEASLLIGALRENPSVAITEPTKREEVLRADRVVFFLSDAALSGASVNLLLAVLDQDQDLVKGRIIFICHSEKDGWKFGGENQAINKSPRQVQVALNENEAIVYRPQSLGGSRHEFPSMIAYIFNMLRRRASTSIASSYPAQIAPSLAERLQSELEWAESELERIKKEKCEATDEVARLTAILEPAGSRI